MGDEEETSVSLFDYSVENHFKAVDSMANLCGEMGTDFDENEINSLASSITFLREWKHFTYEPRTIRLYNELDNVLEADGVSSITLPQFSSASVQKGKIHGDSSMGESSKDFVIYVGGSVWALDWCPRVHKNAGAQAKCEFLAVSAHPPDSYNHKIGVPLTGRGIIQIWCILNTPCGKEIVPTKEKNQKPKCQPGTSTVGTPRGRLRKKPTAESLETTEPKKPRGRPRKPPIEAIEHKRPSRRPKKKVIDESLGKPDSDGQYVNALAVRYPEEFPMPLAIKGPLESEKETSITENQVEGENSGKVGSSNNPVIKLIIRRKRPGTKGAKENISLTPSGNSEGGTLEITKQDTMVIGNLQDRQRRISKIKGTKESICSTLEKNETGTPKVTEQASVFVGNVQDKRRKRSKSKGAKESICLTPSDNNEGGTHEITEQDSMVGNLQDKQRKRSKIKGTKESICSTPSENNETGTHKIIEQDSMVVGNMQDRQRKRSKIKGAEESFCLTPSDNNEGETHEIPEQESMVGNLQDKQSKRSKIKGTEESINSTSSENNETGTHKITEQDSVVVGNVQDIQRKRSKIKGAKQSICLTQSDNNEGGRHENTEQDSVVTGNVQDKNSLVISEDASRPRVVLCLAHNGKVAWDVKWRPSNLDASKSKRIMGYLAVLLGNGSLEVWEVPMPQAMKAVFSSSGIDGTDPRFVKMAPIFRCSKLKCGDTQSIPLTVEWSTLGKPDFLLAGCHDGSVALWKFSSSKSSEDTRPLLFFSADTAPIRTVAWAPSESDPESANIIATAGHGGLKFWDIRDPFHPLWDLHPVPRFIYSLDWLSDPRCVVLSFEDGTMRILSLTKAVYDFPVTGKQFSGTKLQGFSVYNCSSSPIWNVQVSPLTGLAAYCCADGAVLQFQLTSKAVEKDSRYRTPHFLCGVLTMEEDSALAVHTPLPNNPIVLRKPTNESGEAPRCLRSLLSDSTNKSTLPVSDIQPLALTYGEDQGMASESEGASTPNRSNKAQKSKTNKSKNNAEENNDNNNQLALVCADEERGNAQSSEKGKRAGNEPEGFPPKMVAMHRVRWNVNRGSERWLCYGGAAGIVRCQEIAPPAVVNNNRSRRKICDNKVTVFPLSK